MANKTLYVGNLPYSTTEEELREAFAEWNPVDVRLIGSKGFGFVELPEDQAIAAMEAMNGKELGGRPLNINEARPRTERSGGFGGGGGGRRW